MFDTRTILFGSFFIITTSFSVLESTVFAFEPLTFPQSTKIYDRNGVLLYELFGEIKRTPIALSEIPLILQQATIAAEDKDFYKHHGIDLSSMMRAALVNIESKSLRQGASTISQQLARNSRLTREKTFERKFKEIFLSLRLEREYTKDEILEMYLNFVPYGANTYGVEAASQTYFGKNTRDLTLAESAYLVALPKAPSYYSPYGSHRDELDARADLVLQLMQKEDFISSEQAQEAMEQTVEFQENRSEILAPHFVMFVIDQLRSDYGDEVLLEKGLTVKTTLDLKLQTTAEELIATHVEKNQKKYKAGNAALVSINPRNGEVLAMVGSHDYFDEVQDGAVNVAIAPRQPGSSFKPYVYATAFQKGMNPATMLMDVVTNFGKYGEGDYVPRNYNGREHGPISARQALAGSLNIPAVKTLFFAGIDDSVATAERMGITTLQDRSRYGPSLVLGGAEVTLFDHTSAYGVFATGGVRHEPVSILEIKDHLGQVIHQTLPSTGEQILDSGVAYQITSILSDTESRKFIFGSLSKNLVLKDRPVAVKTGTTQAYRDAWTVGFTPSLVTGVWVGNSDNTVMRYGADGSVVAAPIWKAFMEKAHDGQPVETFVRPEGIIEMVVDSVSGKLPTRYSLNTKKEIFTPFNLPTQKDDMHTMIEVDGVPVVLTVYHAEPWSQPMWEYAVQRWAKPKDEQENDSTSLTQSPESG